MLQILFLDIGTDVLPALALGNEAPSPGVLTRPPERRHLIDRTLLIRVFGVLGLTEAVMVMSAFLVGFLATGWRPGQTFPTGHALMAASGGAFAAVVLGQLGNAFACRSATRTPARLGWRTNPLLLWAVAVELGLLAVALLVAPVARLLDQAAPPLAGLIVAALAFPAVLSVDHIYKAVRAGKGLEATTPPAVGR